MTEHTHTDECYTVCNEPDKKFLACEYQNYENIIIHIHDSFCYDEENVLICPLEEVNHEHERSCYNDNSELVCNAIVHQHNEECFRISDGEDYRVLKCGIEVHNHTDICKENVMMCSSEDSAYENEGTFCNGNAELTCDSIVQQTDENCLDVSDVEDCTFSAYETEEDCHTEACYELVDDLPPPENDDETGITFVGDNSDDTMYSITYQAVSVNSAENPDSVDTAQALNLLTENKLTSVIFSYQSEDGTWNTITDSTQGFYSPDKSYRFRFKYENISTEELINNHECKLIIPDCVPHWLNTQQEGTIMLGSECAGKIQVTKESTPDSHKSIVIVFDEDFLKGRLVTDDEGLVHDAKLQGSFYIFGNVLLNKLNSDNQGELHVPLIEKKYIQFESGDLREKYGRLDIIKREMDVVSDDSGDYIKYELVLSSLSSDVDIPKVRVEDVFTGSTSNFVKEYAGVSADEIMLSGETSDENPYNPYEIIDNNDGTPYPTNPKDYGRISYNSTNKKMTWNVGTLKAGTTRHLVYYVKTDPYYMGSVSRGELVNQAKVYSGDTLKDEAEEVFIPQAYVSASKKEIRFELDEYGTGYLNYELKITGNKKNSYDLVNLRLHDYLVLRDTAGNDIHNAKSTITFDEDKGCKISAVSNKNRDVVIKHMVEKDVANNAVFNFKIDRLSPGETITLTYKLRADNLYMYLNGHCELSNHAEIFSEENPLRGNASNYMFTAPATTHTFTEYNWMRKLQGEPIDKADTITIGSEDKVFEYKGTTIEENPLADRTFNIDEGSRKYTIYLNEQGMWDLSSTTLGDKFSAGNAKKEGEEDHIQYQGYLKIQQYNLKINGSETDVESAMNSEDIKLLRTVWLNIDGRKSFSFTPEELKIVEYKEGKSEEDENIDYTKCYAYRLTYYAVPINVDGVGQVAIANEFYAEGSIGVGGKPVKLLRLQVAVSGIIQGNVQYSAGKRTWYYNPDDVERGYDSQSCGSIYWVIRLDGTIPEGLVLRDCADVHRTCDVRAPMRYYKIMAYKCSSNIDPLSYKTYDEFTEREGSKMTLLNGEHYQSNIHHENDSVNKKCEDSFSELDGCTANFDYVYTEHSYKAEDKNVGNVLAIKMNEKKLGDNECIYIIIKTEARFSLKSYGPDADRSKIGNATSVKIFENSLETREKGTNKFVKASNGALATYIQKYSGSAVKEGVVAYMRDGDNWKLISTSDNADRNSKTLYNKGYWHANDLDRQGVYAEWLLHVNWDGLLEGTVDVHDCLPEGFEPVHIDLSSAGVTFNSPDETVLPSLPELYTIPELDSSSNWKKVKFYCSKFPVKAKDYEGITLSTDTGTNRYSGDNSPVYYNPENNEVRFRVGGLRGEKEEVRLRDSEICFVLICKITDPEILLNDSNLKRGQKQDYISGGIEYKNTMEIIGKSGDDTIKATDTSTIKIDPRGSIIKSFAQDNLSNTLVDDKTDSYESSSVYQQFKIVVNPLEYDLSTDSTGMLPPLIDKIEGNLTFLTEDEEETVNGESVAHKGGLEVKYSDGTSVKGYTVQFEKDENKLIINNLPANKKIIITYWTKINSSDPSQGVQIKNTAYWLGYANENDNSLAQVDVKYHYGSGGEVTFDTNPSIKITKADSSNLNKKLSGATFELYKVQNGKPTERIGTAKTTNADGKLTFTDSALEYDTVYCIKETVAPSGYVLDETPHYFAIQNKKQNSNFEYNDLDSCGLSADIKVNICYNSSVYYVTFFNDRESNEISVTKKFQNPEGEAIGYCKGEYRFGIYGQLSDSPLQTLSIIYDEQGNPSYKLNNVPVKKAVFTCAEPEMPYYIYELDDKNQPVHEDSYLTVNGSTYIVSYKSSSNIATANNNFEVTNKIAVFNMPETGGKGLKNYYIYAFSGLALTLLTFALFRKRKS